ncbi:MAG: peptidylprolyl isomerase [Planctomycetes bacterium]|nr:peptidylprolyl isomerase [Planctomycetota bacterium]
MLASLLLLSACALRNPEPPAAPAAWQPPQKPAPQAPAASATASAAAAGETPGAAGPGEVPAAGTAPQAGSVPPTSGAASDPVVALVAGKPIFASELLAQWLYAGRSEARDQIDNLVVGRLVVAEATRLGVRVDPELAERSYAKGIETLESQIRASRKSLEKITLDRYVDQYLGLDPRRYRERLRDDALRSLLGERVVRGWLLQNHHAFLRVIVVRSEEDKQATEAELAAGRPFEEVARERSKDASAAQGGRIAPIVRGNTPIASVAFATEPGRVGGPIAEGGDFLFVRVERRGTPLEGAWDVLGPAVEASLGEQGVDQLELEQWRRAMRERYTVDLSPFLRLAGEEPR